MEALRLKNPEWKYTSTNVLPSEIFNLSNVIGAYQDYGVRAVIESIPNSIGYISSNCNPFFQ
jgi:hypothetical protein